MRCLYCGKQLALFKKLTGGGEFCSDAHKQKYHEEYNRLALNRLMEAQSRQEEQAPTRKLGETPPSAPEKPAIVEPTARGEYFRQTVSPRNAAVSGPTADVCAPVGRAVEFPALAIESHAECELSVAGLVVLPGAARGAGQSTPAAPALFPPLHTSAVVEPATSSTDIRVEPELLEGAVIIDRHPRLGSNGTSVAGFAGFPAVTTNGAAPQIAFPEFLPNPVGAASPESSGVSEIDPFAIPLGESELLSEPATAFEYACEIPASLDPEWAGGLELGVEGASVATATPRQDVAAGVEMTPPGAVEEPEPASADVMEAAEPEDTPLEVSEAEAAPAMEVKAPEVLLGIAPATHEPVINEEVLRALFGGKDDAEAAPPAGVKEAPPPRAIEKPSARTREETPSRVAEAPPVAPKEAPPASPTPTPVTVSEARPAQKPQAAQKPAPPRVEASVSREPLPFLQISIRPAPPGKPRLMQTFQAISLVTATPLVPAWNMLPLRPRMGFGREPGPGAALLERNKTPNGADAAKSSQSATEAPPEETLMDLPVPSFASAAGKPKSGLSRWFKLSVMVGVLGLAAGYSAGERTITIENPQHMSWSLLNAGNE